jgi:hypothetical protein
VRGASALQDLLRAHRDPNLRALVVWEPVIWTDVGPPTTSVMARLSDPRVVQFWDPQKALSRVMVDRWRKLGKIPELEHDTVIWDFVALYDPGARWDGGPPPPRWHGYPVVKAIDGLRAALREVRP